MELDVQVEAEPIHVFEWSDTDLPVAVVTAIADVKDSTPLEVAPLYETINPDALTSLCQPTDDRREFDGAVQFEYEDYVVVVDSNGMGGVFPDTVLDT